MERRLGGIEFDYPLGITIFENHSQLGHRRSQRIPSEIVIRQGDPGRDSFEITNIGNFIGKSFLNYRPRWRYETDVSDRSCSFAEFSPSCV
jgi:hypothetical protein